MPESEFQQFLLEQLNTKCAEWSVKISKDESLLYKVMVIEDIKNNNLTFKPDSPRNPRRGSFAFETDLLIKDNNGIPLVVIELKYGGFSTHDIIIYSTKAVKHKEVYPYLRYGLVVGNIDQITNKFFVHNVGFDFAMAFPTDEKISILFLLIKEQIDSARQLFNIMQNERGAKIFKSQSIIEF